MLIFLFFYSGKLMKKAKNSMRGTDNCNCACREYWTTKCTVEYRWFFSRKGLKLNLKHWHFSSQMNHMKIKSSKLTKSVFFIEIWTLWYGLPILDIPIKTKNKNTQRAEAILNKISNSINKTYTGLISVLQGFQKCIARNPSY